MNGSVARLFALCALFCFGLSRARADEKDVFQKRLFVSPHGGSLPYRLYVPTNYDPKVKYPLVLFLHGAGERGDNNTAQIRDCQVWVKPETQARQSCFVLAPQCPNLSEVFQVYGYERNRYNNTFNDYQSVEKTHPWKHYKIPVGNYYVGKRKYLFFMNFDWGSNNAIESRFRNVKVYEAGQSAKAKPLTFRPEQFEGYDKDSGKGKLTVEDGGATLFLSGDAKRRMALPYTITPATWLEFDFQSTHQANTHGLGFTNEDTLFEARWVQAEWWQQKHEMPKDPSLPMRLVMEMLPAIQKEFPNIDASRLYLTGLSMGGYGTWDLLARRPTWFAAAVPICGGGDVNTAPLLASMPLWDFHGGDDGTVPPSLSRQMIGALWEEGGTPRYTEYPKVGHDSWVKAYAEPELPVWLFAQHRDSTPPSVPTQLAVKPLQASSVQLHWNAVTDPESGIHAYRIYRDGRAIDDSSAAEYVDRSVAEGETHSYSVSALNGWRMESLQSAAATVTIPNDTFAPAIQRVQAIGGPTGLEVTFSKPVEESAAQTPTNYTLDDTTKVVKAVLLTDKRTVALEVKPPLTPNTAYHLTVGNIKDTAAHPNALAVETPISFRYAPGLLAFWRFDEGQGNNVEDDSGNGNKAWVQDVGWARGRSGKALDFDGMWGHMLSIPNKPGLALPEAFTVSAWVYRPGGQYLGATVIARQQFNDHLTNFALGFDDSLQVRAQVGTTGNPQVTVTGHRLDALAWHHLAMTYAANTLELFIDGVSQGKAAGSGSLQTPPEPITIGGGFQGRDPFRGRIDEVRLYNHALSAEEIRSLASLHP